MADSLCELPLPETSTSPHGVPGHGGTFASLHRPTSALIGGSQDSCLPTCSSPVPEGARSPLGRLRRYNSHVFSSLPTQQTGRPSSAAARPSSATGRPSSATSRPRSKSIFTSPMTLQPRSTMSAGRSRGLTRLAVPVATCPVCGELHCNGECLPLDPSTIGSTVHGVPGMHRPENYDQILLHGWNPVTVNNQRQPAENNGVVGPRLVKTAPAAGSDLLSPTHPVNKPAQSPYKLLQIELSEMHATTGRTDMLPHSPKPAPLRYRGATRSSAAKLPLSASVSIPKLSAYPTRPRTVPDDMLGGHGGYQACHISPLTHHARPIRQKPSTAVHRYTQVLNHNPKRLVVDTAGHVAEFKPEPKDSESPSDSGSCPQHMLKHYRAIPRPSTSLQHTIHKRPFSKTCMLGSVFSLAPVVTDADGFETHATPMYQLQAVAAAPVGAPAPPCTNRSPSCRSARTPDQLYSSLARTPGQRSLSLARPAAAHYGRPPSPLRAVSSSSQQRPAHAQFMNAMWQDLAMCSTNSMRLPETYAHGSQGSGWHALHSLPSTASMARGALLTVPKSIEKSDSRRLCL